MAVLTQQELEYVIGKVQNGGNFQQLRSDRTVMNASMKLANAYFKNYLSPKYMVNGFGYKNIDTEYLKKIADIEVQSLNWVKQKAYGMFRNSNKVPWDRIKYLVYFGLKEVYANLVKTNQQYAVADKQFRQQQQTQQNQQAKVQSTQRLRTVCSPNYKTKLQSMYSSDKAVEVCNLMQDVMNVYPKNEWRKRMQTLHRMYFQQAYQDMKKFNLYPQAVNSWNEINNMLKQKGV